MGLLDIRDRPTIGQYFWYQMQAYDLTYIGMALTTGEGVGAARYDSKKPVDIHEGIDRTLLILQHRFKSQSILATKPIGKGTGMGMSISYQIVTEKHGGKLECFSTPSEGTELVIQIPITQKIS